MVERKKTRIEIVICINLSKPLVIYAIRSIINMKITGMLFSSITSAEDHRVRDMKARLI